MSDYNPRAFPPFAVTTDVVVLTISGGQLMVAVVRRAVPPDPGAYALPGGFVHEREDLDEAARRELIEETGLKIAVPHIAQFRTYGNPNRDPRMRVVTVAYWAIVPDLGKLSAGGDAESALLLAVEDLLLGNARLAFDHHQILVDGLEQARRALETTTVATGFCDREFTIPELRQVYETVWGLTLDPGNFQKKVTEIRGFVIPTGERRQGGPGRPAETYVAGPARAIDPPFRRPSDPWQASRAAPPTPQVDWSVELQSRRAAIDGRGSFLAYMDMPLEEERSMFPLLDRNLFDATPKAKKRKDVQRMLFSPGSEDWVTWNVVRLLARRPWKAWWPHLLELVSRSADERIELLPPDKVDLWKTVPAPLAYERASRERMLASDNRAWQDRAANSKPVEGDSEIELSLAGQGYLVFVEAKLGADISLRTTYDPYRNQVVRNIDCLLEDAGSRRPYFWMFTRDRDPDRTYVRLLEQYRHEPAILAEQLPHRSRKQLAEIGQTLAVITWSELLEVVTPADREEKSVWAEILRRTR